MQETGRSPVFRYGVALFSVAVLLLVRWLIGPLFGTSLLMLFLVAVTVSARFGGLGPGLLATGLVAASATYLLPEPFGRWVSLKDPYNAVRLSLFAGLGVMVSLVFNSLRVEAEKRQRALYELAAERARFHAFMAHSPAISFIKDSHGRYVYVSEPARRRVGLAPESLVGKTAFDLFPVDIASRLAAADAAVFATGDPVEVVESLPAADGELRHWLVVKFPFQEAEDERLLGAVGVDITERMEAEERLKQSERRLAEAQRVGRIGSWERDLGTNEVTWSRELYCLFGLAPEESSLSFESFLRLVHPSDRERFRAAVDRAVREHHPFSLEYQVMLPDGQLRVMHDQADTILNGAGEPVRLIGTCQDVTERRQAEEQLEAARQRVLTAEVEKKRFTREVLRATTNDKLNLVEPDEMPREGRVVMDVSLADPENYSLLRHEVQSIAEQAGMSAQRAAELVLATGEAVTNAIKHADGGRATVLTDPDQVIVRVADAGHGIRPEDLPATVLQAGYSTKVSLGMGFTLLLEMSDRIWLATGPDGTVVQLASWIHPERHQRDPMLAMLERF